MHCLTYQLSFLEPRQPHKSPHHFHPIQPTDKPHWSLIAKEPGGIVRLAQRHQRPQWPREQHSAPSAGYFQQPSFKTLQYLTSEEYRGILGIKQSNFEFRGGRT